ncbi:MAG: hypothetical protein K0Q70_2525 [Rhodospirillales bacterium]|jgi:hypothetical protein|nr:hypothetical protein [Rhodospirillales bacterium]
MSRSQLIAFACALLGLAAGIALANWKFTEPGVLTGARLLFGVFGTIIGYLIGNWLFVTRKTRGYSSE